MNKSDKKYYYLFITVSFLFVVLTTNYISLSDIVNVANQTDVISYTEIAKNAPLLKLESDIIIQHVALWVSLTDVWHCYPFLHLYLLNQIFVGNLSESSSLIGIKVDIIPPNFKGCIRINCIRIFKCEFKFHFMILEGNQG